MILSSTTRFIIQASNTGSYAKLMGNGRSYRLPGRNIQSQLTFAAVIRSQARRQRSATVRMVAPKWWWCRKAGARWGRRRGEKRAGIYLIRFAGALRPHIRSRSGTSSQLANLTLRKMSTLNLFLRQIGRTLMAALRLLHPEASFLRTAIGVLQAFRRPEETPSSVWVGTMRRPMCLG